MPSVVPLDHQQSHFSMLFNSQLRVLHCPIYDLDNLDACTLHAKYYAHAHAHHPLIEEMLMHMHIHLPFMAMPSIKACSWLGGQYLCILCSTLSLVCGQPCIIHYFCLCRSASWLVAVFYGSAYWDICFCTGCFWINNLLCVSQDKVCIICTCYTGKCTVTTGIVLLHSCWSSPPMVCLQLPHIHPHKTVMVKLLRPCSMPKAFHLMLLYFCSTLK